MPTCWRSSEDKNIVLPVKVASSHQRRKRLARCHYQIGFQSTKGKIDLCALASHPTAKPKELPCRTTTSFFSAPETLLGAAGRAAAGFGLSCVRLDGIHLHA